MKEVSDEELKKVIADFLEMGHVENIMAMFRKEPKYYGWSGEILNDERFAVRLGVTVLFEELKRIQPEKVGLAVPSLAELLSSESPNIRGEAVSVLGIIGNHDAIAHIEKMKNDPSPQVKEMAEMVMEELT